MTPIEFDKRVKALQISSKATASAYKVLVKGWSYRVAAEFTGSQVSAVHRLVKRIEQVRICRCCGQPIR